METLLLFDGTNLFWRSFHGLAPSMDDGSERADWAIHGVVQSLAYFVRRYRPSHVLAAFDDGPSEYRRRVMPAYKAGPRAGGASEVGHRTIGELRRLLGLMGMATWSEEAVEADDVIAELALRHAPEAQAVWIVSGDKDMRQLVRPRIRVLEPTHAYDTPEKVWDEEAVRERYGIDHPWRLADWLALVGDVSDGVPGVRGIGPKKATALLAEHGSLWGVLEARDGRVADHAEIAEKSFLVTCLRRGIARCAFDEDRLAWDPIMPGDASAQGLVEALEDLALARVSEMWAENRLWHDPSSTFRRWTGPRQAALPV